MTPVIPAVLDLNKIFNFLAGCSEGFKKQVTKDIQFLAAGDSHGLVEPDAAKNLLELFGPSSDHPLCLKEIKSTDITQYPRLEKTKTGECIAYSSALFGGNLSVLHAKFIESTQISTYEGAMLIEALQTTQATITL